MSWVKVEECNDRSDGQYNDDWSCGWFNVWCVYGNMGSGR